jgi:hypothetical protein
MDNRPPKPVLSLTLGVVGHRPNRPAPDDPNESVSPFDAKKVREAIDDVIARLQRDMSSLHNAYAEWFAKEPPLISMISPLAEGADRIAAQAALDLGAYLDVVLPFAQESYENTFEDDPSRQQFVELLAKARATLVLPGVWRAGVDAASGGQFVDDKSYELCGLTVLAQCDMLIAVWDGKPGRLLGGTGGLVDEAARQCVPIIVIDPSGRNKPVVRWHGDWGFPVPAQHAEDLPTLSVDEDLSDILKSLIRPPADAQELDGLRMYLESPVERRSWHFGWKLLLRTFGLGRPVRRPADALQAELTSETPQLPPEPACNQGVEMRLRAASDAADSVAVYFAHAFRSAFVFNFLLGAAAAVCVAASLLLNRRPRMWSVALELLFIVGLVTLVWIARRKQWRRRWLEAREVAERLRVAMPFWMVGVWPHSLSAYQPAWTGWYAQAILREQPMYFGDLPRRLPQAKALLRRVVDDQYNYHSRNFEEMERLNRGLEFFGILFVLGALANAALHLFHPILQPSIHPLVSSFPFLHFYDLELLCAALAIILPAFAAACYGIRLLGDLEDTAHRSARSRDMLDALRKLLDSECGDFLLLRTRARQTASVMLSEVENWRVAVGSRDLSM